MVRICGALTCTPVFGKKRLDEISLADIEDFKAALRKKLSRARPRKNAPTKWAVKTLSLKTINNVLAVFRRLLSLAYEQGVIDHMPRVKLFRAEKPPFDFLGFDEAERLIAAADPEWRTMMLTAMRTGLRQGELMGLQWTSTSSGRAFTSDAPSGVATQGFRRAVAPGAWSSLTRSCRR